MALGAAGMMKRFGVLAALVAACLAGRAAAQEGTGQPEFRLRSQEIQAVYPPEARASGVEGEAVVACQTYGAGFWSCGLISESPAGAGFGPAALALVKRYEVGGPKNPDANLVRSEPFRIQFQLPENNPIRAGGVEYRLPARVAAPSPDALYAAWPRAARFTGVEGWASLWCTVTVEGRTTACAVGQEGRVGLGFGEAALKLAPLYRFTPGRKAGAPAAMSIPIMVSFACDVRCRPFEGEGATPGEWTAVPTPAQVQAAYPASAKAKGLAGFARLACAPTPAGVLRDCRVLAQAPADEGFGAAALALADRFKAEASPYPGRISFSVAFDQSLGVADRVWLTNPFPGRTPAAPLGKAGKGKAPPAPSTPPVAGRSRLRCQVAQGGELEACTVLENLPSDPEVERQVLENLKGIRTRTWTQEGHSTVGSTVELNVATGPYTPPWLVAAALVPPVVAPGVIDYRPNTPLRTPNGEDMARYYPDRAQRMEVGGTARMSCAIGARGALESCQVLSESPPEYGFGDAALKVSRLFRYSPESIDGTTTGEPVVIPFSFAVPR